MRNSLKLNKKNYIDNIHIRSKGWITRSVINKKGYIYTKYLRFKNGQYSDLEERYLDREEILNDGYVI